MSTKFEKLKSLLRELFQLDQPDLDFGLYRIMHAKAKEVSDFLERDLLAQVKAGFEQYKPADKADVQKKLDKAIEQANDLGVDPETTKTVKELRAQLAESVDLGKLEGEIYDDLISFFSRYYSDGDFISKRRYSRDGKYAIPYDGEEVKLHWANADQFYIKTSEYLRDYAFRLRPDDDENPMRVHFRLADAAEGEHGNVKPANGKDRVFILCDGPAVEDGELVIRFEFRPDARKQKELTAEAEEAILAAKGNGLASWITELKKPHEKADGEKADYSRLRAHLTATSPGTPSITSSTRIWAGFFSANWISSSRTK